MAEEELHGGGSEVAEGAFGVDLIRLLTMCNSMYSTM